ncbi:hypothetical protein EGR_10407 [Echinococcus granulosus]|uniref:Uncharacterized protein n=1 Tax=Echinococcus granulosus TaxID=6210 RepID=W6U2F1_ECHGR|nr:hypothetical protein EGR_10407 [Echinococcus granulosus]EUB54726.1 hypothetical protein EGR_10407 [Echinococcus granulosus]
MNKLFNRLLLMPFMGMYFVVDSIVLQPLIAPKKLREKMCNSYSRSKICPGISLNMFMIYGNYYFGRYIYLARKARNNPKNIRYFVSHKPHKMKTIRWALILLFSLYHPFPSHKMDSRHLSLQCVVRNKRQGKSFGMCLTSAMPYSTFNVPSLPNISNVKECLLCTSIYPDRILVDGCTQIKSNFSQQINHTSKGGCTQYLQKSWVNMQKLLLILEGVGEVAVYFLSFATRFKKILFASGRRLEVIVLLICSLRKRSFKKNAVNQIISACHCIRGKGMRNIRYGTPFQELETQLDYDFIGCLIFDFDLPNTCNIKRQTEMVRNPFIQSRGDCLKQSCHFFDQKSIACNAARCCLLCGCMMHIYFITAYMQVSPLWT